MAFALKYLGHSVPERLLSSPRVIRINTLIPIALLSALVAVQSASAQSRLVIDHRIGGLAVAAALLVLRAPFPLVVISSAITSAFLYRFI